MATPLRGQRATSPLARQQARNRPASAQEQQQQNRTATGAPSTAPSEEENDSDFRTPRREQRLGQEARRQSGGRDRHGRSASPPERHNAPVASAPARPARAQSYCWGSTTSSRNPVSR
ncbi:unnamed protein product [Prorocentrum cordatum]|uniref:Uncharacterized protein n=1 Tax=Prorocentrum cordatum TaxID=2364126 RepID=A0ABN9T9N3_9DINO|nr:unnamed protein product [Polarella glacialis]